MIRESDLAENQRWSDFTAFIIIIIIENGFIPNC